MMRDFSELSGHARRPGARLPWRQIFSRLNNKDTRRSKQTKRPATIGPIKSIAISCSILYTVHPCLCFWNIVASPGGTGSALMVDAKATRRRFKGVRPWSPAAGFWSLASQGGNPMKRCCMNIHLGWAFWATPFGLPTSLFELRRDTSIPHAGFKILGWKKQTVRIKRIVFLFMLQSDWIF